jgi:glutamyl-Q tRNA(Asp) synthetase
VNLTLESLLILDMIDRKGSFAAAAVALDRVPSALTYSVRKLEDDLDVLLFDRRGHRAQLTPAGLQLLQEGRHLLLAASDLEQRVKRTATGRETELHIVLNSLIPFDKMLPVIDAFDREESGTRLRFTPGVLTGAWEKLIEGRANLVIGVTLDGPEVVRTSGRFQMQELGAVDWVFAVAPTHPLASATEPLSAELVRSHRAMPWATTASPAHADHGPAVGPGNVDRSHRGRQAASSTGRPRLRPSAAHLSRTWPPVPGGKADPGRQTQRQLHGGLAQGRAGKSLKWFIQHLAQPCTAIIDRPHPAAGAGVSGHAYVGRFAPSPSGPLHAGSLAAALASYLDARVHGGRWLLRIEDIDETRTVPGAADDIVATLAALDMRSDGPILVQSQRKARYQLARERWDRWPTLRLQPQEIADSRVGMASDGAALYPGTCRHGLAPGKTPRTLRLRVPDAGQPGERVQFTDRWLGPQVQHLASEVGDFVLQRADGFWAYQLAVVVDDAEQGVTDIVRGADLLDSTARQIYLQGLLGYETPRYLHVPLLMNASGKVFQAERRAGAGPGPAAASLAAGGGLSWTGHGRSP